MNMGPLVLINNLIQRNYFCFNLHTIKKLLGFRGITVGMLKTRSVGKMMMKSLLESSIMLRLRVC